MPLPDSGRNGPFIGLNMSWDEPGETAAGSLRVPAPYIDAVVRTGGVPLCLPIADDPAVMKQAISMLDALLFIGAADYRPERYGGHPQPERELVPERRDRFDFLLARYVLEETDLPVLGICGGCQLLALARGGSLVQDIGSEWEPLTGRVPLPHAAAARGFDPASGSDRPPSGADARTGPENTAAPYMHPVTMKFDSLFARIAAIPPGACLETNSFHHQAVHPEQPGRDLQATARTADGVVEAVEPAPDSSWGRTGRFLLGLQWHAERMQDRMEQQHFFRALTAAAGVYRLERKPPHGRPAR